MISPRYCRCRICEDSDIIGLAYLPYGAAHRLRRCLICSSKFATEETPLKRALPERLREWMYNELPGHLRELMNNAGIDKMNDCCNDLQNSDILCDVRLFISDDLFRLRQCCNANFVTRERKLRGGPYSPPWPSEWRTK